MTQMIEFPLDNGGTVVVEVDETISGTALASRPGEIAAKAKETFEAALTPVTPVAEALLARLQALSKQPDEITVQFGVKMTGSLNAIISSAAGEANFSVTMKWDAASPFRHDAAAADSD